MTCVSIGTGKKKCLESKSAGNFPAPATSFVSCAHLLRFAIDDVATHDRVELAQFDSIWIIAAILRGQIHVRAFCAAHLDNLPWSLLSHFMPSFPTQIENLQTGSIAQLRSSHKLRTFGDVLNTWRQAQFVGHARYLSISSDSRSITSGRTVARFVMMASRSAPACGDAPAPSSRWIALMTARFATSVFESSV